MSDRYTLPLSDPKAELAVVGDNERKAEPEMLAHLEELELALSPEYPYKLLARYFQVIAKKA